MKHRRTMVGLGLLICALALPLRSRAEPTALGFLEIRGLDDLAEAVFTLTKATGQPVAREQAALVLYGALNTMPGLGIAPHGYVRALLFAMEAGDPRLALLLPVENQGEDYLKNLGEAGWALEEETADGLLQYSAPDGSDRPWPTVFFLKRGAVLVAAQTAEDARVADSLRASLPPILPVEGHAAIQVRPAAFVKLFGTRLQEKMEALFNSPSLQPETAAIGLLYLRAYLAAGRQIEEIVCGFSVADEQLKLHTRVVPVAGTTFARWLGTLRTPSASAAALANAPQALFGQALNTGDLSLLGPPYFRYLQAFLDALPASSAPEALQAHLDQSRDLWNRLSGDFSCALLPPNPNQLIRAAFFQGLTGEPNEFRALFRRLIEESTSIVKQLATAGTENLPFDFEISFGDPREYRGVAIDLMSYDFQIPADTPIRWPESLPTRWTMELAWLPDGLLGVMGGPALTDSLVDLLLDKKGQPLTEHPAWKAAFPDPDDHLIECAHAALFDTLRSYLELADAHTGLDQAAGMPETSGHLESLSYIHMGGLMNRLRFPLADLGAAAKKIREAREKAMAEMIRQLEMEGELQIEAEPEYEPWEPEGDDVEPEPEPDSGRDSSGAASSAKD